MFDSFKGIGRIPEVKAAMIVTTEGAPIASVLPQGVDEKRVAAITASLLSISELYIDAMKKGNFDQLNLKGSDGYLLILKAGPDAILIISTSLEVRLGFILLNPKIFKPPDPPEDFGVAY